MKLMQLVAFPVPRAVGHCAVLMWVAGGLCACAAGAEPAPDAAAVDARRMMLQGDYAQARSALEALLGKPGLSAAETSILRLHRAECFAAEGNWDAAVKAFQALISQAEAGGAESMAPAHQILEARERIEQIARVRAGKPQWAAPARMVVSEAGKPALSLHVAPGGSDAGDGTAERPFATLERARDEVRALRKAGRLAGAAEVVIEGGRYRVGRTFELTREDSGSPGAPVVFRAARGEEPVFTGAVTVRDLQEVSDPQVRSRFPDASRLKVREIDLKAHGITNVLPLTLGGFASGRRFQTHPIMELYHRGKPLALARGPNDGYCTIAEVTDAESFVLHGLKGSKTGRFTYVGDRPDRWRGEENLLLYGYWFFGWADSYERVQSIDPERNEVVLEPPYHGYGYRKGQWFYAVNALSELDLPGEWCLDASRQRIYFLPPEGASGGGGAPGDYEISTARFLMAQLKDVSDVRLEGITWEMGCADGISIEGGQRCVVAGGTVRRLGGSGITVSGGEGHVILSCDVHCLGRGGISVEGGDRKTLTPGGHVVENCHVYDLSRIDHTYTPAVIVSGVGHRVRRNWFHHIASSAMRVGGNNHLVEFNEMNHVVLESDDQGAIDMWGDPTFLGNVYRYNYFHHAGNWRRPEEGPDCGQAGIRLDDAISGVLIHGNTFDRCAAGKLGFGAIQIHGGKDNIIDANAFSNCRWVISFSSWGQGQWLEFIKPRRQSAEIDSALYRTRYESWDRQEGPANVNWIWRNTSAECGAFLHRNSKDARVFGNVEHAPNMGTPRPGRFDPLRLPTEHAGLYEDRFRRGLPLELRQSLREER